MRKGRLSPKLSSELKSSKIEDVKEYIQPLDEYQTGGKTKYISDPEEFKLRQQAYNDSLFLYQNNPFSELDPSSQPVYRNVPIDLSIEEVKKYNNSITGPDKPRLIYAQKDIDIEPAYWRSYYNSDVGSFEPNSAPAYWGVYKKPTQPVAQLIMAKPIMGL